MQIVYFIRDRFRWQEIATLLSKKYETAYNNVSYLCCYLKTYLCVKNKNKNVAYSKIQAYQSIFRLNWY